MKQTIVTELDSVEYGIWDEANELFLTDADDIEAFIKENNAKVVAKALAESVKMLLESLKESIDKDLTDCYDLDHC